MAAEERADNNDVIAVKLFEMAIAAFKKEVRSISFVTTFNPTGYLGLERGEGSGVGIGTQLPACLGQLSARIWRVLPHPVNGFSACLLAVSHCCSFFPTHSSQGVP